MFYVPSDYGLGESLFRGVMPYRRTRDIEIFVDYKKQARVLYNRINKKYLMETFKEIYIEYSAKRELQV